MRDNSGENCTDHCGLDANREDVLHGLRHLPLVIVPAAAFPHCFDSEVNHVVEVASAVHVPLDMQHRQADKRLAHRLRVGHLAPLAVQCPNHTRGAPTALGHPTSGRDRRQLRSTAPNRRLASATAAARTAAVSSAVSVRSGARSRSEKATDLRPSPTCAPV